MGRCRKSSPGYSGANHQYDHPFPKLGAHDPQSKLASQIMAKRCQMQVACTERLLERTIALPNSAIVDPLRATFPQTIKSKLLQNRNRYQRALHTRPAGTHYLTAPMLTPIGARLLQNLGKIRMRSIGLVVCFPDLLVCTWS